MANMTGGPWANMEPPGELMDSGMFSPLSFENLDFSKQAVSPGVPITSTAITQPQPVQRSASSTDLLPQPQTLYTEERLHYEIQRLSDEYGYNQDQLWRAWALVRHGDIMAASLSWREEDVKQGLTILRNTTVFTTFRQLLYPPCMVPHFNQGQTGLGQVAPQQESIPFQPSMQHNPQASTSMQPTPAQGQTSQHTGVQGMAPLAMQPRPGMMPATGYGTVPTVEGRLQHAHMVDPSPLLTSRTTVVDNAQTSSPSDPALQRYWTSEAPSLTSSFGTDATNQSSRPVADSPLSTATPMSTPAMSFTSHGSTRSTYDTPLSTPATPCSAAGTPSYGFAYPSSIVSTPTGHQGDLRGGPIRTGSSKLQKFSSKNQKNRQMNYQCSYCRHFFASLSPLYTHEAEHHDAKFAYVCRESGCTDARFETLRGFNKHHRAAHKDCMLAECSQSSRFLVRGYKQACACGFCGKLIPLQDYKPISPDWVTRNDPVEANHRKQFLIERYHEHINTHRTAADIETQSEKESWMRYNWQRALIVEAFVTDNPRLKDAWVAQYGNKSAMFERWDKLSDIAWAGVVEAFEFVDHSASGVAEETIKLLDRCLRACKGDTQQMQPAGLPDTTTYANQLQSGLEARRETQASDGMHTIQSASNQNRDSRTLYDQVHELLIDAFSSKSPLPPHEPKEMVDDVDDGLSNIVGGTSSSKIGPSPVEFYEANKATAVPGSYLLDSSKRFHTPPR